MRFVQFIDVTGSCRSFVFITVEYSIFKHTTSVLSIVNRLLECFCIFGLFDFVFLSYEQCRSFLNVLLFHIYSFVSYM